jgi:hypothetical protein
LHALAWALKARDDRLSDERIFKEFRPATRVSLAGDDDRALSVAIFEQVNKHRCFFMGVVT